MNIVRDGTGFRLRNTVSGPALAVTLIMSATPVAALAQDEATAPQGSEQGVEDIVVTAQFRQQSLQDTPLAITAVSGDMLTARSQTNLSEVANQAPSVTLKPQGATYGPSMTANIRGIGQYDFNPAFEPGVGIYVDDVYYPTLTGSILDLLDVDRVEILRGPQGTLAGKNSIGGAVKFYSRRPTGSNTGQIAATYGSRNRIDLRATADVGLTDMLALRLSGVSRAQDGYITSYDFGCIYPAGGSATFTNDAGQVVPVNPEGGIPSYRAPRTGCVRAKEGEVNYQAIRGQLRWQPTDKLDINISGDYTRDSRNSAGSVLLERYYQRQRRSPNFVDRPPGSPGGATDINPYGGNIPYDKRFLCGQYCNYANYFAPADTSEGPGGAFALEGGQRQATDNPGRLDFRGWGVSGTIEYELSDSAKIVSITSYRSYHTLFDNDDDLSPLVLTNNTNDLSFWAFTQELRLNGSLFDDAVNYTLGAFYLKQRSRNAADIDTRNVGLPLFSNDDVTKANTKAVFAHLSWTPFEPLTLTAGLRYTDEFKSYMFSRRAFDGSPLPDGAPVKAVDGLVGIYDGAASDRIDYRLNIRYELNRDMSVYAQVATGFKGGGITPRPFNARQVLSFAPETLTSYELGWKSELFDRMVRLNVATYFSRYKDIQLPLPNCTALVGEGFGVPCALIVNAGTADIKGFEVETTVRPTEGLVFDGSLSLVDFDYKKFSQYGVVTVGGPTNLSGPQFGDYPVYTPRWKWSAGLQYRVDLGDAGSITPRVDASYQDVVYASAVNRDSNKIDAYTIANARLTWENSAGDLQISAQVTNIFDKYYLLTVYDASLGTGGLVNGQPGRPREWALTLTKSF